MSDAADSRRIQGGLHIVAACALVVAVVGFVFRDGLRSMVSHWSVTAEYSHGFLLPVIAGFLVWQKKDILEQLDLRGAWGGLAVVLFGLALFYVGEWGTLYVVINYAFVVVVAGLLLAYLGWQGFRHVWFAALILFLMVPLPNFVLDNLSARLQLWSTDLGVALIHAFGLSVYAEGNVIDIGSMKLQVVEACNGLRYLFPLMTLALVCAHFFHAAWWKKALLFLSSLPITLVMNSLRIALIALMAEYAGVSLAEGFLHDFEGWAVFLVSLAALLGVMWVLVKVGGGKAGLFDVFRVEWPAPTPAGAAVRVRPMPRPFLAAGALIVGVALVQALTPPRQDRVPAREEFARFPLQLGAWQGKDEKLDQIFLEQLKLTDYLLTDYVKGGPGAQRVNLYVSYNATQRKGESSHSPGSCIPRGGWEIAALGQRRLDGVAVGGVPLEVNRTLIRKGEERQLVYYWFQQRGRVLTNEYLVKWYLFWDALTKNRTDGAMVRVTMFLRPGECAHAAGGACEADAVLSEFVGEVVPLLPGFVPG